MLDYAARINSFMTGDNKNIIVLLKELSKIDGITSVDLNYPEHFDGNNIHDIQTALEENGLKLNGIAVRFREEFINGELGNKDGSIAEKALKYCYESIDVCRELGGKVMTVWLGYDGYDYCFQSDYEKTWKKIAESFKKICDYGKDIQISIEYKPYQPRVFSLISSLGDTMTMLNEVDRPNLGVTMDFCHMLMKAENPALGVSLLAGRNKLYGVHLNDGNHLNDDGLMVGMMNFIQTVEFLYYVKKANYNGVLYFDTFPIREDAFRECAANIKMVNRIISLIDSIGMEEFQRVIDCNDALEVHRLMLKLLSE